MNKSKHIVRLPIEDYEELIKNQRPKGLSQLSNGSAYDLIIAGLKTQFRKEETDRITIYYTLEK